MAQLASERIHDSPPYVQDIVLYGACGLCADGWRPEGELSATLPRRAYDRSYHIIWSLASEPTSPVYYDSMRLRIAPGSCHG